MAVTPPTLAPTARVKSNADCAFERIAAVGTASAFAIVLGSLACVVPAGAQGLDFRWHWVAVVWGAVGLAGGWRLWHLLWRVQAEPTPRARRRLLRYCFLLLLGGVAAFAYPFRFVAPEKFQDVLTGLGAAVIVLTFAGWMLFRLFRSLSREEA